MKTSRLFFRTGFLLPFLILTALAAPVQARDQLSVAYTATRVESEFEGLDGVNGARLTGIWVVEFLPGEVFQMRLNDVVVVEGFWTLSHDQLTLSDMAGPLVCTDDQAGSATYRVRFQGFSITLETVADSYPWYTVCRR